MKVNERGGTGVISSGLAKYSKDLSFLWMLPKPAEMFGSTETVFVLQLHMRMKIVGSFFNYFNL